MIAGWDVDGPGLFYVDSDGSRIKGDLFSVGSGSTFAYGVLDSVKVANLGFDEAIEVARRAIFHATHRDAFSGGSVNGLSFAYYIVMSNSPTSVCYNQRRMEIHLQ